MMIMLVLSAQGFGQNHQLGRLSAQGLLLAPIRAIWG